MAAQGLEIERKFLVAELPGGLENCEASDIRQGYLAVGEDGAEVRVRERGSAATLTAKQGRGRVRLEEEIEIDSETFERLWRLTDGRRLEKRRHLVPAGEGLTIELDVYDGDLAGLAVAEIEFASEGDAERWEPPAWFGPELTGDARFSAQQLALHGVPDGTVLSGTR